MNIGSVTIRLFRYVVAACVVFVFSASPAAAKEAPPVPYHGAPLIPWAKKIGENRFRSPRDYDHTLEYYHKTVLASPYVVQEKIINTSGVRAVFLRNKKKGARWEGLNIYEYKGTCTIFTVLSDAELEKIAKQAKKNAGKKKPRKKGK
jgi:hypothetical protein